MTGKLDEQLLVQIGRAMDEAVRRGGAWIVCRPGCAECCRGEFEVSALDAWRLRQGLAALDAADPDRARQIRERAAGFVEDDDAPCAALDPDSQTCDLYAWRPLTCRVFGPAVRNGGATGACELCFSGATEAEIDRCAVDLDVDALESAPAARAEAMGWRPAESVARALTGENGEA